VKKIRPRSVSRRGMAAAAFVLGFLIGCAGEEATGRASPAFEALALGTYHTCGLTAEGLVYCWGENSDGQLGDGTTVARSLPTLVAGEHSFEAVAAGGTFTCGLIGDGGTYCWGRNHRGQIGDGTTTDRSVPVAVPRAFDFVALSLGGATTCALEENGGAYCWGANGNGQFGNGEGGDQAAQDVAYSTSPKPTLEGIPLRTVEPQGFFGCGLSVEREAYCWGQNTWGQLGTGSSRHAATPMRVATGLRFNELSVGPSYACGLTGAGTAHCWGKLPWDHLFANARDQLHAPTTPQPVEPAPPFRSVSVGFEVACGLTEAGEAYCWGDNPHGQLGDGTTGGPRKIPHPVVGGHAFRSLIAGYQRVCGVTTRDTTYCWGRNDHGQLGDGTTTNRSEPVRVLGP